MIGIYSILLGVAIVACALFLLRREFMRAYFINTSLNEKKLAGVSEDEAVLYAIGDLEKAIKEMNEAFYDITGDLEGNYSVHDKELQLLMERLMTLEEKFVVSEKNWKSQQQALERLKKLLDQGVGLKTLEVMSATDLPQSPEVLDAVKKAPSSEVAEKARETVVEVIDIPHQEDDIKSKIIELRSQGYSLKQIAKMLDVGLGEIQLILNMKRQ